MRKTRLTSGILLAALLSGCASVEVNREITHGRIALLGGNPGLAIGHFERAAALNGATSLPPLHEGTWTFVGRAHYHAMNYPEARQALERALALDEKDNMARLYLAMVRAQARSDEANRSMVQAALKDLYGQIEYIVYYSPQGRFWDPSGALRAEFEGSLKAISSETPDWAKTLSRIAVLALAVEEEVNQAHKDESRANRRSAGD